MKILHIIKKPDDRLALDLIAKQKKDPALHVSILLIHDAVYMALAEWRDFFVCMDDVEARGVNSNGTPATYEKIVELLLESDSVVSW